MLVRVKKRIALKERGLINYGGTGKTNKKCK